MSGPVKVVYRRVEVMRIAHFYLRVQRARVQRRLSWRMLARAVGVSRPRLERIMWEPKALSEGVLERLERALGVTRAYWSEPVVGPTLPEPERRRRIARALGLPVPK